MSSCDAKSECGIGAMVPGTQCPLNVCCGYFDYCGTTSLFCQKGRSQPCQSNCDQPGSNGSNSGDVRQLVIG